MKNYLACKEFNEVLISICTINIIIYCYINNTINYNVYFSQLMRFWYLPVSCANSHFKHACLGI